MATLSAVIVPAKALKGGKHKVRISVSHNSEFRYIVTDIVIDSLNQFKNGKVVKRADAAVLNTKLYALITKYQHVIDTTDYINGLTCSQLVSVIKDDGAKSRMTIREAFDEYLLYSRARESTKTSYKTIMAMLLTAVDGNMVLDNIRHQTVLAAERTLTVKRGMKPNTVRVIMAMFSSIVKYAVRCGYVQYKQDPFLGFVAPPTEVRDSWLTMEQIRAIRDVELNPCDDRVRSIFMLSYYLGGINMVDLLKVKFDTNSRVFRYCRQKTEARQKANKFVEFDLPDEARPLLDKLLDSEGLIAATERQRAKAGVTIIYNRLKKIGRLVGIDNLIYYSARKSFSQHAFDLGVKDSVIDYILGHGTKRTGTCLFNYVKVTPEMATKAVRTVLDQLKNGE